MKCLRNIFLALHLSSNRSQMTSKCGKDKKVAHEAIARCVTDVLSTFWRPVWSIRELTKRRLSHDGAVGSPYSPASSSCRNLNLRFAVKTTMFRRGRQIFPLFLKFAFIFWQGELFKLKCLNSEKRKLVSHTLMEVTLWTNKNLYFCTTVTSQQIQSFCTVLRRELKWRMQGRVSSLQGGHVLKVFSYSDLLAIRTVLCFDRFQCWLNSQRSPWHCRQSFLERNRHTKLDYE